jgi:long-subunit acyl-CoA synthetase (AMP-forming)
VAFPGGALTWKALQERVLKAAQGLKTRGAEIEAILGHSGARLFLDSAALVTELEDADPLTPDHPEPDPEDPFLLLYTSGTTASPKGVPHRTL